MSTQRNTDIEKYENGEKLPESHSKREQTEKKHPKAYRENEEKAASSKTVHQFIPFLILVLAVFLTACYIFSNFDGAMGKAGTVLRDVFCGLFGWPAFILPLVLVNLAIYWKKYVDLHMTGWKLFMGFVLILTVSATVQSFHITYDLLAEGSEEYSLDTWSKTIFGNAEAGVESNWSTGIALHSGGFFGGLVGGFARSACGYIGSPILLIALVILSSMFYFSVTPVYVWNKIKVKSGEAADRRRMRKEAALADEKKIAEKAAKLREKERREDEKRREKEEAERRKTEAKREKEAAEEEERKKKEMAALLEAEEEKKDPVETAPALDSVFTTGTYEKGRVADVKTAAEQAPAVPELVSQADESAAELVSQADESAADMLDRVLGGKKKAAAAKTGDATDAGAIMNEKAAEETPAGEEEPNVDISDAAQCGKEKLQAYFFPPIDLLSEPVFPPQDDITLELRTNAQKIMDKLNAFNVKITKIEYSRGPTITRYELYPEASTRIRAIASLSDDIAMVLGTNVRIEAPIPGKNAVGIEVPNVVSSTVYIREMLDSEKFRTMSGKLCACLGKDVGGNMVFMDIAKMPHLLIAGTTGSGKSVCLNSIIVSLLYKVRPDEVKFIMIDPKKIEMGMYNGMPHMKVPVVTNMKRAAGTLNAAVNEMEARYSLFEDTNSRSLDGYNKLMSEQDPDFVPLPRIVIIIDELADLMMTAPDQIEDSIIRLAQKARAAGIHLIIGTQRPSANVITGLIKANVPSKIAFTVVSNMESRIILDTPGAEKLIGKGDMLFSPVGSMKPARVQGAFVDDDEVRRVAGYVKEHNAEVEYDRRFIDAVDAETDRIEAENSHSKPDEGEGDVTEFVQDADPMFNRALHIAADNGTIATSLLQRKLSVGFGRAAKMIDRMEALGFISGANGTKPREVKISPQQLQELESMGDVRTQGKFN